MEWMSRRRIGLAAGLAAAAAVLGAVLSFAPQDPTFINLRYPKDGIANWLGYPGALAGGSLVEAFGWAALLVPAAIAYWTLCPVGRPRGWRYAARTAALLLLADAWAAQGKPEPGLGLASAGLIGWCGADWVRSIVGPWASFVLLTAGLALALWHQVYAPGLRSALKQFPAAGRLLTPAGRVQAQAWLVARVRMPRAGPPAGHGLGTVVVAAAQAVSASVQALGVLLPGAGSALRRGAAAPLAGLGRKVRGSAAWLRDIRTRTAPQPFGLSSPAGRPGPAASPDAQAQTGRLGDGPDLEARVPAAQEAAPGSAAFPPPFLDGFETRPYVHPAQVPWHDENASHPVPPHVPLPVPPTDGAQWLGEASASGERLREAQTSQPRGPRTAQPRGGDSAARIVEGKAQGEDQSFGDAWASGATGSGPTAPSLPGGPRLAPEEPGRERWERLLRRYRDNLDPDWEERGWRAHEERDLRDDGTTKPRGPR